MYPQISWELVADPLGSAEHTLETTVTAWSSHTVLIHQHNRTFIDTVHLHLLTFLFWGFPDMSDSEPSGNFGYKR